MYVTIAIERVVLQPIQWHFCFVFVICYSLLPTGKSHSMRKESVEKNANIQQWVGE